MEEIEFNREFKIIVNAINIYKGYSFNEIKQKSRKTDLVECRHLIFYFSRKYTHYSFQFLSNIFDLKNHVSALHGVKKIQELKEFDKKYFRFIQDLDNYILKEINSKKIEFNKYNLFKDILIKANINNIDEVLKEYEETV